MSTCLFDQNKRRLSSNAKNHMTETFRVFWVSAVLSKLQINFLDEKSKIDNKLNATNFISSCWEGETVIHFTNNFFRVIRNCDDFKLRITAHPILSSKFYHFSVSVFFNCWACDYYHQFCLITTAVCVCYTLYKLHLLKVSKMVFVWSMSDCPIRSCCAA